MRLIEVKQQTAGCYVNARRKFRLNAVPFRATRPSGQHPCLIHCVRTPIGKGWPVTELTEVLPRDAAQFPYLSKFSGMLTPQQMRTDLILREFDNDKPYRQRVYN